MVDHTALILKKFGKGKICRLLFFISFYQEIKKINVKICFFFVI